MSSGVVHATAAPRSVGVALTERGAAGAVMAVGTAWYSELGALRPAEFTALTRKV